MTDPRWNVKFLVHRKKGQKPHHFDVFDLEVNPDEYILDVIERIWAFHDRSLVFHHACHHSVCGACGMRVNGVEKLTCITLIHDVTRNGGIVKVEPLRNFSNPSDLVVDMETFYTRLEQVGFPQVVPLSEAPDPDRQDILLARGKADQGLMRLVDCIECGMCISACPVPSTSPEYLGPAVLAAVHHQGLDSAPYLMEMVDHEDGVWRCHSAYECTEVCPANVEPAWRIMELRKQVVKSRIKNLFRSNEKRRP